MEKAGDSSGGASSDVCAVSPTVLSRGEFRPRPLTDLMGFGLAMLDDVKSTLNTSYRLNVRITNLSSTLPML